MDQPLNRNQSIVARVMARETFAAIGKELGISRERVRQIFNDNATPDQKRELAVPLPENGKPGVDDLPKGEPRHRIHVLLARKTSLTAKEVRAGVRRWLAGNLTCVEVSAPVTTRLDLYVADSMRTQLVDRCVRINMDVSRVIRSIIAALEKEAQDAPPDSHE